MDGQASIDDRDVQTSSGSSAWHGQYFVGRIVADADDLSGLRLLSRISNAANALPGNVLVLELGRPS